MLNLEVLKCHEDLITVSSTTKKNNRYKFFICENIIVFGYLGAWGGGEASIIRLCPSWFTSTLYFLLNDMSNIEAI